MADFNDYSQKGSTLMQQALKKYAEGDFEAGENDRKEANRYFDMFYADINSEAGKMSQLYGESRNFGVIYNVIEQNIGDLLETEKGKKFIKEAYNMIKNNSVLTEQFKIYDFFENACYDGDTKSFVNESLSVLQRFDKKDIKENNEKLISLIRKYKLDEYVEIPEETEKLYESIEYVLLNEKNFGNIDKYVNATNVIVEHVKRANDNKDDEISCNTFEDFKKAVEKQEEELNENINEDEKKLLDLFVSPKTNKKVAFENCKKETLKKINEAISASEDGDRESWRKIYESVSAKNYSDKMTENIINCAEMMEICNTIEE